MHNLELSSPLYFSSATSLASAIRSKEVSSEEATKTLLQRIEEVNPTLNAVVTLDAEKALNSAREADQQLKRGELQGALHGVPMTIKDSFDTAGVVSTAGTLGRKDHVPDKDATIVKRLKDAGAILLGKTNTPELTLAGDTHNLLFGRTNNPYNPERSPGGSSGGAAAIVSVGGAAFDIGTDTGGSVRNPSHACGLCGIKPTSGRVPRTGHIVSFPNHLEALTTVGPIARYVDDLIALLPVISGSDGIDPFIYDLPLGDPALVKVSELKYAFYSDNGIASPTAEINDMVQRVAVALEDTGAQVKEARPSVIPETVEMFLKVFKLDRGHTIKKILTESGTVKAAPYLEWALEGGGEENPLSPSEFCEVFEDWALFRSSMAGFMDDYDIIICPVSSQAAFPHGVSVDELRVRSLSYTATYNLTGWPAAVVRASTSDEGLPLGIQVVGRPWQEDKVLAVAKFIEGAFGGYKPEGIINYKL